VCGVLQMVSHCLLASRQRRAVSESDSVTVQCIAEEVPNFLVF